jgi:hypothetical protein
MAMCFTTSSHIYVNKELHCYVSQMCVCWFTERSLLENEVNVNAVLDANLKKEDSQITDSPIAAG